MTPLRREALLVTKRDGPAEAASPTPAVERNTRTADNLLPQWSASDSVPSISAIVPHTSDPCIGPCPDRVIGLAVPGTAFAAHEMPGHLRHRHALGQPQDLGIEIEVPLRPADAAMDLQQLSVPDQVANGDRLESERLGLATAPDLVPVPLHLDQLGKPRRSAWTCASPRHWSAGCRRLRLRHQAGRRHAPGPRHWHRSPGIRWASARLSRVWESGARAYFKMAELAAPAGKRQRRMPQTKHQRSTSEVQSPILLPTSSTTTVRDGGAANEL